MCRTPRCAPEPLPNRTGCCYCASETTEFPTPAASIKTHFTFGCESHTPTRYIALLSRRISGNPKSPTSGRTKPRATAMLTAIW